MTVIRLVTYCCVLSAVCCSLAQVRAELRDPFTFGPREGEAQHPQQTLIGILWDAARPLAIFGEELVAVGDVVAGWRVIEIKQEGVVIQRDEHREFITPGNHLPE